MSFVTLDVRWTVAMWLQSEADYSMEGNCAEGNG